MSKPTKKSPNIKSRVIRPRDLPFSCPPADVALWSAHPKVFLPIEKTGTEVCPYCGTRYLLKDE